MIAAASELSQDEDYVKRPHSQVRGAQPAKRPRTATKKTPQNLHQVQNFISGEMALGNPKRDKSQSKIEARLEILEE